jgi:hypothetical protein
MKKLATFEAVRDDLRKRRNNTKYFNRAVYNAYIEAYKTRCRNIEAGTQTADFSEYREVWKTPFYNKNEGAYCEFQCVLCDYIIPGVTNY